MSVLGIPLFIFAILLLLHSVRDFLQYRKSKSWFAQEHKKAKRFFDSSCDKLGLSFLKDKEWLHAIICAFFGIIFLIISLFLF